MKKMLSATRGFTIIELLIVLAIVGILAAVGTPHLLHALRARQVVNCVVSRIDIQNAERAYVVENGKASTSLDELAQKKYIPNVPKCPSKGVYMWIDNADPKNPFRTLGCSVHYFPTTAVAGVASLFSSDFNDGKGFTFLKGEWKFVNGQLSSVSPWGEHRLAFGDKTWKDYTIALQATLNKGSGYGVYYRADGKADITGYCFQYDPGYGNEFTVRKVVAGREEKAPIVRVKMPAGFDIFGAPHEITISVKSDQHTISIDNKVVLSFRNSTFTSGSAGLRTWGSSTQALFDKVIVTPK